MSHPLSSTIALAGSLIELLAALVVAWHILLTLGAILRREGSDRARAIVADGVLAALSFAVAGTLLKTLALDSWMEIRAFAVVLGLRTLLKRVFKREQLSAQDREPVVVSPRSCLLPADPRQRLRVRAP